MLGFPRPRDARGRTRRGARMQLYTGGDFWPLDPRADEVTFDDVCIGNARDCRYGRMTREFYSVAEHEVLVSIYAERLARERGHNEATCWLVAREGLVHDGSEAYTGDMIHPLKVTWPMRGFRRMERRIQDAVFEHFQVFPQPHTTELVHEVDLRLRVDEMEALMLEPHDAIAAVGMPGLGAEIAAMKWEHAAAAFCQRFAECFPEYQEYT